MILLIQLVMKNVAHIVDQRNNEIHEYRYSTNVDETT